VTDAMSGEHVEHRTHYRKSGGWWIDIIVRDGASGKLEWHARREPCALYWVPNEWDAYFAERIDREQGIPEW
jgi:hypothetical protein